MKVKANIPKLNQRYYNPFKEKGIYPFNKIGRVLIDKDTAEILMYLGENDSTLSKAGAPWIYDETKHDIAVYFPKFYSKRNWNQEELSDSFITEIPVNHVEQIPEYIKRKGFEIFPEFVREDGSVRPYILIGATKGVSLNNQLRSIIGYKPTVNKTLQEFLNESRFGRNNNWNIETIGIVSMIQFLYKIAFQDLDSQKTIGLGYSNRTELGLTGSTIKLGNHTGSLDPFQNSIDKPNEKIKYSMSAENGKLKIYSNGQEIKIKTYQNKTLEECLIEETDNYCLYSDGELVTIEQYAPGTYDEYLEIKELMKTNNKIIESYEISWNINDDIELLIQLNNNALNKPIVINENEEVIKYEFRTIPIPIYFCCRVDKKTGEIYSGRGYENLFSVSTIQPTIKSLKTNNGYLYIELISEPKNVYNFARELIQATTSDIYAYIRLNSCSNINIAQYHHGGSSFNFSNNKYFKTIVKKGTINNFGLNISQNGTVGDYVEAEIQTTKSNELLPFIKNIMPNGIITLETNSTEDTYDFIYNDSSERIPSLHMRVKNGELDLYNLSSDQMPLKTINNNGIVKMEETEDYIIYIDKDAIFTRVEQYVVGSYQEFLERKALIDSNSNLMKDYKIEWTSKDDSDLFIEINNNMLNKPTTIEINEEVIVYKPKSVPTTYECCFRLDKKENNFYIGEGYENFCADINNLTLGHMVGTNLNISDNIVSQTFTGNANASIIINALLKPITNIGEKYYIYSRIANKSEYNITFSFNALTTSGDSISPNEDKVFKVIFEAFANSSLNYQIRGNNVIGTDFNFDVYKDKMIIKSDIPKPFVKNIMPSSKLVLNSGDISATHSFIVKGVETNGNGELWLFCNKYNTDCVQLLIDYTGIKTDLLFNKNIFIRPTWRYVRNPTANGSFNVASKNRNATYILDSFTQLIIYKGNLTETELKFENNKLNTKLINYNLKSNNQHLIKYSKFKSLNIYSKLTNEEFEIESNKQITHEDNRNTSNEYNQDNQISIFGIEDFYGNCNSFVNGIQSKDDGYYINNKKTNLIPITNTLNNTFKYGYIKKIADLGYLNIAKEVNYINDQPDERLSLFFGIENGELVYHDSPNDPFPLKTINGNGIQKWEDTKDYTIYIDKDVVFTRIEQYVSGSYQTFIERKNDIDSSSELLKIHDITWTSEDDSKLIQDINNEALKKLESQRMMLPIEGEEQVQPIILEPKTVPTTYECCFRVDKKEKNFYIGEGYENLFTVLNFDYRSGGQDQIVEEFNDYFLVTPISFYSENEFYFYLRPASTDYDGCLTINSELPLTKLREDYDRIFISRDLENNHFFKIDKTMSSKNSWAAYNKIYAKGIILELNKKYKISKKVQITKTSTPKPFVKSVMPSGKLAFVTNAELTTHSFINKSSTHKEVIPNGNLHYPLSGGMYFTLQPDMIAHNYDTIASSFIRKLTDNTNGKTVVFNATITINESGLIILAPSKINLYKTNESFKQLLIYKGNLTEAELKAELAKNIKLKHFEYKEENSNLYYTDLFKSHSLGQVGICILNSNYTSLNFGGIFAADFSEIETFKNNLTGARVCYYP